MNSYKEYPTKIKIAAQLLIEAHEEINSESWWSEAVEKAVNELYPVLKELPNTAVRRQRK